MLLRPSFRLINQSMPQVHLPMSTSEIATNSPIPQKQQQLKMMFVKIFACLIALGFAYRIYYFSSSGYYYVEIPPPILFLAAHNNASSSADDAAAANYRVSPPASHTNHPHHTNSSVGSCDIFKGEWVKDPRGPSYTSNTCDTIEQHQNCIKNGRPDSGYIYWRWKPRDCNLPRLDPHQFLHYMTNKSFAFIGDSISRNHVQSLLCILSQAERPVEVYHDKEYRSKRWLFDSHNFTLSVIWSPFLTQAKIFEDFDGHASDAVRLHLDEPDSEWVKDFGKFDYIEIGAGKWFLKTAIYYENKTIVGCHNCKTENVSELRFDYAYRRALQTTLGFITKSEHKVYTLFRTTTPDHFENGEWNTGGYCNRTVPFREGETELRDIDMMMRDVELEEFKKAESKGSILKLFDTTQLALLRPDGHPGPYRSFHPFEGKDLKDAKVQNDCLHWCLPGPIDSWNDLLISILRQAN